MPSPGGGDDDDFSADALAAAAAAQAAALADPNRVIADKEKLSPSQMLEFNAKLDKSLGGAAQSQAAGGAAASQAAGGAAQSQAAGGAAQGSPMLFSLDETKLKEIGCKLSADEIADKNRFKEPGAEDSSQGIRVTVEELGPGRPPIVSIGPCDLSGVGGHKVRGEILKNITDKALEKHYQDNPALAKGHKDIQHSTGAAGKVPNYERSTVCATVAVRGRLQMLTGDKGPGAHANACVKCAGEVNLQRWEPRDGAQRTWNDTVCATLTCTATAIFKAVARSGAKWLTGERATAEISKGDDLKALSSDVLDLRGSGEYTKGAFDKQQQHIADKIGGLRDKVVDSMSQPGPPAEKGFFKKVGEWIAETYRACKEAMKSPAIAQQETYRPPPGSSLRK